MAFVHRSLSEAQTDLMTGISEAIPDGLLVLLGDQVLFVNDRLLQLLDLPLNFRFESLQSFIHPSDLEYVEGHVCDPWEHDIETPVVECTLVSAQGIERDVELRTARLSILDLRTTLMLVRTTGVSLGSFTNPPHRALRYQRYLESNSNPVLREAEGRFYYASQSALELLGVRSLREVYGRDFIDFVQPDKQAEAEKHFRESRFKLSPTIFQTTLVRPDGATREVSIRIGTIPCSDQGLQNVTITDITEQLKIEQRQEITKRIGQAAGLIAEMMLKAKRWQDVLPQVLETMGQATSAKYVRLVHYGEPDALPVQVDAWPSGADRELISILGSLLESQKDVRREFQRAFSGGQAIQFLRQDMPERMRSQFESRAVALIVVLPIQSETGIWGGLWVEYSDANQEPTDAQLVALKGCAATISGAMRRQAHADELARASDFLSTILNNSSDGVYMINLWTEEFEFASEGLAKITGYSVQEWLDGGMALLVSRLQTDDREKLVRRLYEMRANQRGDEQIWPILVREYLRTKDGTYRHIEVANTLQYDAQGHPARIIGSVRDVTERTRSERAAAEGRDEFADLSGSLNEGLVLYRDDGRIYAANEAFCRMLGRNEAELFGRQVGEFLDLAARYELEPLMFTHHAANQTEEVAWHDDNRVVPTLVSPQYRLHGERGEGSWYSAVMDISQRKEIERRTRESEENFRSIFENMGHALFLFDADLTLQSGNGVGYYLFGVAESWRGLHASEVEERLNVQPRTMVLQLDQALRNRRIVREGGVVTVQGVDGLVDAEMLAFGYGTDRGKQVALLIRDVTDIRRLEGIVRETESLRAAQSLTKGTAHDFINLLTVCRAVADSIRDSAGDKEAVLGEYGELVKHIAQAHTMSDNMLQGILGQSEDEEMLVAVNSEVGQLQKSIGRLLGTDIELRLQLASDPVYVRMNQTWFDRVLLNLCVNARDAMPEGGKIDIRSSLEQITKPLADELGINTGLYGCVSVHDTGRGIDPEHAAHLFDYRYTTRHDSNHYGLGLATVKYLISQSSGGIRVHSEPNRGTTFSLYVPAIDTSNLDC